MVQTGRVRLSAVASKRPTRQRHGWKPCPPGHLFLDLVSLNQLTDADRITLAMTVASDGISASCGLNANFGPDDPGRDLHRRYLRDSDALLGIAKEPRFHAADMQRSNDNAGREEQIAASPAAGDEGFTSTSGGS